MVFVSNLNYVAVAVVGALQVLAGAMTIGGLQAFIQFSRLFSQPMGQIGGMLTLMQSCLASAGRVFELLDAPEIPAEPARGHRRRVTGARPRRPPAGAAAPSGTAGRVAFEQRHLRLQPGCPVGPGPVLHRRTRADRGGRGPHRRRQDHRGEPPDALLRTGLRPDHGRRHGHRGTAAGCAAGQVRHGDAGRLAVHRQHPGQHRVRPPRRRRRRDRGRGAGQPRGPVRPRPARRLRHACSATTATR